MKPIEVHKPGTECQIGEEIPAIITAVTILPDDHVVYTIVWWSGRTRNEADVSPCEIHTANATKAIGFHSGNGRCAHKERI